MSVASFLKQKFEQFMETLPAGHLKAADGPRVEQHWYKTICIILLGGWMPRLMAESLGGGEGGGGGGEGGGRGGEGGVGGEERVFFNIVYYFYLT